MVARSILRCAVKCDRVQFCRIACFDSLNECHGYDIVVSSSFVEELTTDLMTCYTNRPRSDVITTSTIILGTPRYHANGPTYGVLTDGIYNMELSSCFISKDAASPFLVFDLGEVRLVRKVIFMSPNAHSHWSYVAFTLGKIRIRLSVDLPDKSNSRYYHLLGYWEGPATPEQFYTISDFPAYARYVIFLRPYSWNHFFYCNMEIIVG